jgi:peptide/nickel transport system substrate-binding protein
MITTTAPFDNNDVRLALKFAIDRQELIDKLLRGNAVIGNDHPIPPGTPYFAADLAQRAYDPEKSRFHLKKAGLDKLTVPLSASNVILDIGSDAASLYRESAAKAGLNIEVVQEPADGYWSNVWQKKPFCESYFGARPTPDAIFSLAYGTNAPWNETFWSNSRFDELMKQGRAELDEAKRKEIYGEMQRILHEEGGTIVPFFPAMIDATSDKIATGIVAGNLNMDGGRAADRWWFA